MPSGPSDAVLSRAALLRAAGSTWEAVADALGKSPDAVRKWPDRAPDRWRAALAAAERRVVTETTAEAVLILRQLLRAKDEKVRRDAARFLLDLRFRLLATPDPSAPDTSPRTADARRLVAFLEAHSDDELAHFAEEVDAADAGRPPLAALGERPELAD